MKFRWTKKELKEVTDDKLIETLIDERLSELNPYCPLAKRLKALWNNRNTRIKR